MANVASPGANRNTRNDLVRVPLGNLTSFSDSITKIEVHMQMIKNDEICKVREDE